MDVNCSGDLQRSSGCCDVSFAQHAMLATYMGHKMKKGVKGKGLLHSSLH